MLLGWHVYNDGEEIDTGSSLNEALDARHDGDFVWIRLGDPHPNELQPLAAAFGLPELAVEDAMQAHQRPKLERYGSTSFLVMKPAMYDDEAETISLGEVHVFQGPDFVISIRHGDSAPLDEVKRRLAKGPEICALGSAAVLYTIADQIVDAYVPVVRELERDIEQIEREVFDVNIQAPTERIYALIREVLEFQRATASLLMPLDDLAKGRVSGIETGLNPYFRDVADHARLVHERTSGFRELLDGALQANVALIGLQENRDQRKISAWAAIALVPTIIGGIWGMNVQALPLDDWVLGFPFLLVLMVAVSGYLYWRLHRNDWL